MIPSEGEGSGGGLGAPGELGKRLAAGLVELFGKNPNRLGQPLI